MCPDFQSFGQSCSNPEFTGVAPSITGMSTTLEFKVWGSYHYYRARCDHQTEQQKRSDEDQRLPSNNCLFFHDHSCSACYSNHEGIRNCQHIEGDAIGSTELWARKENGAITTTIQFLLKTRFSSCNSLFSPAPSAYANSLAIGRILQNLHPTSRESHTHGCLHIPSRILVLDKAGEGRDQGPEEW